MKLIELVTKSLEIIGGGWPENVVAMSQGYDGMIRAYVRRGDDICIRPDYMTKVTCRAIDFETALVTRDQYESALAASQKVEWDGVGLPPVGTKCHIIINEGDLGECEILFVGESLLVWRQDSTYQEGSGYHRHMKFRPICSEADKKRSEIIDALANYTLRGDAADIYSAISAGKIHGVRIE